MLQRPHETAQRPAGSGTAWSGSAEQRMFEGLVRLPHGHSRRERLRRELVCRYQGLVETLARRFRNRGEPMEDLVQAGNLGLVKAIDRFDVGRGNPFAAYAVPMILGEIRRHFRDTGWAVHVPRRLKNLKLRLHTAMDSMAQALGRPPTREELAEALDVSVAEVGEGLRVEGVYTCLSLDLMTDEDNDRRDLSPIAGVDGDLELVVDRESLWPLIGDLPDRERTVILMRFYGNQTQAEIARELGISQVQVSRSQSRACSYLKDRLTAA